MRLNAFPHPPAELGTSFVIPQHPGHSLSWPHLPCHTVTSFYCWSLGYKRRIWRKESLEASRPVINNWQWQQRTEDDRIWRMLTLACLGLVHLGTEKGTFGGQILRENIQELYKKIEKQRWREEIPGETRNENGNRPLWATAHIKGPFQHAFI